MSRHPFRWDSHNHWIHEAQQPAKDYDKTTSVMTLRDSRWINMSSAFPEGRVSQNMWYRSDFDADEDHLWGVHHVRFESHHDSLAGKLDRELSHSTYKKCFFNSINCFWSTSIADTTAATLSSALMYNGALWEVLSISSFRKVSCLFEYRSGFLTLAQHLHLLQVFCGSS